jgi:hypothetical protein
MPSKLAHTYPLSEHERTSTASLNCSWYQPPDAGTNTNTLAQFGFDARVFTTGYYLSSAYHVSEIKRWFLYFLAGSRKNMVLRS